MSRESDWLADKVKSVEPKILAAMTEAGFQARFSGFKDYLGWRRDLGDDTTLVISTTDFDIDGHPRQPIWMVNRLGDNDTRVEVGPMTLHEALAGIERLPSPNDGDGLWIEVASYEELETVLSAPEAPAATFP